jgi:hypothetical protein
LLLRFKAFIKSPEMKIALFIPLLFLVGCLGDAALPIVSSTTLPVTKIFVDLGGPDRNGNYHYYVHMPDGTYVHRFLGKSPSRSLARAEVKPIRDGVYRIQWGRESNSFFTVIDVSQSIIVEDSNRLNPKGESLRKGN